MHACAVQFFSVTCASSGERKQKLFPSLHQPRVEHPSSNVCDELFTQMSSIASSAHKSPYFCFFFSLHFHMQRRTERRTRAHKNKLNERVEKSKKERNAPASFSLIPTPPLSSSSSSLYFVRRRKRRRIL